MASVVPLNGLQRIGVQASQATAGAGPTYSASREIQVLAVDDNSTGFGSGNTALDDVGTVTNEADAAFDNTPSRTDEIVTHEATFSTGVANFTHRRVSLHDDTAANVSASSDTLVTGVDGFALTKTSDFEMTYTVTITYSDQS